ncbi:MAG: hypothetical protein R3E31_20580 [Chloroflexota bacterium]
MLLSNTQTQGANTRAPGSGSQGIRALAVDGQGNLYVGGAFSAIGHLSANRVARWDGSAWHILGGDTGDKGNGVDGVVYALAVDSSGNLYVGGDFQNAFADSTAVTSISANRIAKWDGAAWTALGAGIGASGNGVNGAVWTLALDASENLALGGQFNIAYNNSGDSVSANYVALWNGAAWSALGADGGAAGNGVDDFVRTLAWQGSTLFVGGDFATAYNSGASSVGASRVAQWSGGGWMALGGGVNGNVYALLAHGSDVYVGGQFNQADGLDANRIARWDGAAWHPLGAGSGFAGNGVNGDVYALGLSSDGLSLLVGGTFDTAYNDAGSSVTANRLAAWDLMDTSWSAFGDGLDAPVYAVQALAYSIWVGGGFTRADGQPTTYIGRWLDGVQVADVAVDKTAVPTTLTVGETAVYTITVSNSGPISSTNVVLTDTLSLTAQMVISPTASQGTCTAVADPLWTVQCSLGDILVGGAVTVTYAVAPEVAGALVNVVLAAGETADPDVNNNIAQVTITVEEPATATPTLTPTATPTATPTVTPEPSALSLRRSVLGSAGNTAVGGGLRLHGTLGQSSPISGQEGAAHTLGSGYWEATVPILRMPGGSSINWQEIDLSFPPLPPGSTIWLIPQVGAVHNLDENLAAMDINFHVEVYDELGTPMTSFTEPYTVTINYEDLAWQAAGIEDEATITLVYRDDAEAPWQNAHPCAGCGLDTQNNQLVTLLNHATEFAVVGQTVSGESVFLPIVRRP